MSQRMLAAMLLKTPHADPYKQNSCIINEDAVIVTFCVSNIKEATRFAEAFADIGFDRIELCPDFIADEVELIKYAVADRALVGVVRFCSSCKMCSSYLIDSIKQELNIT